MAHKEFVPLLLLSRLQPGAVLAVKVNPADRDQIVILWDEVTAGAESSAAAAPGMMVLTAPPTGESLGQVAAALAATGVDAIPASAVPWAGSTGTGFVAAGAAFGGPASGAPAGAASGGPASGALAGAASGSSTSGAPAGAVVGGPTSGAPAGAVVAGPTSGAPAGAVVAPFTNPDQATVTVDQIRAWLRQNGLAGTALIERLVDSGQTLGDDRPFTMQTTVDVPGYPPFRSPPTAAMIPLEKVGRVALGVRLPVKVAPDNFDLCTFLWDEI